ncbi:MAG: GGDEF domain-containing protein [Pirellulaceae bacterium]
MNVFVYIFGCWVLPSILLSLGVGGYIGYSFALRKHWKIIREEREKTLTALQSVVTSAEELSTGVDQHNSQLKTVGQTVDDLTASGDYEEVKQTLLNQIASAIESNKKLENEIVFTRFRLEEQAQELDKTRQEARTDPLSGVGNRKAFDETLQFCISRFQRQQQSFALLMIDVDHFKWINDTHGHAAGDDVIARIGDAIRTTIRPTDFVCRFGGDEFSVIFDGVNEETATRAAMRLRETVERKNFDAHAESRIALTLSMGLAVVTEADSAETIFQKADSALYRSKEGGRNRLSVFREGDVVKAARHDDIDDTTEDAEDALSEADEPQEATL